MKINFLTDCRTVMDTVYESDEDSILSLTSHIKTRLHILFCPHCAEQLRNLQYLEQIMKTDFFPPSPDFSELLMERISAETIEERVNVPAGFSLRGWVIIGFFVLLSLSSSFFGGNFIEIADEEGLSFLLPVGLTIGLAVTCYGALFIGSHLKELSDRFGLRCPE